MKMNGSFVLKRKKKKRKIRFVAYYLSIPFFAWAVGRTFPEQQYKTAHFFSWEKKTLSVYSLYFLTLYHLVPIDGARREVNFFYASSFLHRISQNNRVFFLCLPPPPQRYKCHSGTRHKLYSHVGQFSCTAPCAAVQHKAQVFVSIFACKRDQLHNTQTRHSAQHK